MAKQIRLACTKTKPGYDLRFTFVEAGDPIGHGRKSIADKHKLVIECLEGRTKGERPTQVIDALTCMHFPDELAVFENLVLSQADTDTLRTWALKAIVAKAVASGEGVVDACIAIDVSPRINSVSIVSYAATRYAAFMVNGRTQEILLEDGMTAAESLQKTASDFRARALRYLAFAEAAETASRAI
ncbi:hypothetical protein [Acidovorax sp. sic0104]|uniref:hypothetical protein n=1 Tax=Acidovorax sp. sic0104 TaxID=2854784 RepID=UPI001C492EC1|nr:hypothetical protein [Acidovorax sp. sic0104]MBV7542019.1 hypothetical protein [Acidovorax sp. sic0104]